MVFGRTAECENVLKEYGLDGSTDPGTPTTTAPASRGGFFLRHRA
jgi:hypothetical protein